MCSTRLCGRQFGTSGPSAFSGDFCRSLVANNRESHLREWMRACYFRTARDSPCRYVYFWSTITSSLDDEKVLIAAFEDTLRALKLVPGDHYGRQNNL